MGFKKDGKKIHNERVLWDNWLQRNEQVINLLKLPLINTQDREHWEDFIDNNVHDPKQDSPQWTVEEMSHEQRVVLYQFLKKETPNSNLLAYLVSHFDVK